MFFLSGATGLAYQVIWFKRFAHVWGSSSLAFASVGASFLFGLGVGAYLMGRWADSFERPLGWYGFCELLIGVAALVIPQLIRWLITASAGFYASLPDEPMARYLLQFGPGYTLLVIGPPCVLMGGTLPLLIRELTARDGALDQATGWLYAINTFGAAAGCFLTGFVLLPTVGLTTTNQLAAGLNVGIGLLAVLMARNAPARRSEQQPLGAPGGQPGEQQRYIGTVRRRDDLGAGRPDAGSGLEPATLAGIWRVQLLVQRDAVRSAGGDCRRQPDVSLWVAAPGAERVAAGDRDRRAFAGLANRPVIAAVAFCGSRVLSRLAAIVVWQCACVPGGQRRRRAGAGRGHGHFVSAVRRSDARARRARRPSRGKYLRVEHLGSIVGASLTAVVLFPRLGTAGSVAAAMCLYLIALLLLMPMRTVRDRLRGGACAIAGAGVIALTVLPQNPLRTNVGMYIYGDQSDTLGDLTVDYFAEGASSNVLVTHFPDGHVSLRVNGKVDASDGFDMATQAGAAYLPRLLRNSPSVLVIGFGSGTTPGASLLFPDAKVTCCEIEPAVFDAAGFFSHVNHRPQEKTRQYLENLNRQLPPERRLHDKIDEEARLTMVFGDGRTLLHGSPEQFDLIISEPSNPWLAGVSNLFTQEFFATAKAHLKPGGVLAQWIQTYQFTLDDYLMIVRTMRSVFPHYGMISIISGVDTLLLASDRPLLPDESDLTAVQRIVDSSPEIAEDLWTRFATTNVRILLLSRYTVSQEMLDAWSRASVSRF